MRILLITACAALLAYCVPVLFWPVVIIWGALMAFYVFIITLVVTVGMILKNLPSPKES
jgi:hypothetical protein